ncbi:hypothetical protein [Brasilonema sp. UFV-L1]|uniref:hypothetical protein n=1 Tax=Brasilonema sp. UFV-L1 TaxID=2234130 RepID=UPI00145CB5F6|nr:hypothetical protein [Brasilonema sp. UFV-L1]
MREENFSTPIWGESLVARSKVVGEHMSDRSNVADSLENHSGGAEVGIISQLTPGDWFYICVLFGLDYLPESAFCGDFSISLYSLIVGFTVPRKT